MPVPIILQMVAVQSLIGESSKLLRKDSRLAMVASCRAEVTATEGTQGHGMPSLALLIDVRLSLELRCSTLDRAVPAGAVPGVRTSRPRGCLRRLLRRIQYVPFFSWLPSRAAASLLRAACVLFLPPVPHAECVTCDARAVYRLGRCYLLGVGCAHHMPQARSLFEQAAQHESADAAACLGLMAEKVRHSSRLCFTYGSRARLRSLTSEAESFAYDSLVAVLHRASPSARTDKSRWAGSTRPSAWDSTCSPRLA